MSERCYLFYTNTLKLNTVCPIRSTQHNQEGSQFGHFRFNNTFSTIRPYLARKYDLVKGLRYSWEGNKLCCSGDKMANYYKRNTRKRSETFIVTLGLKHHIADEKLTAPQSAMMVLIEWMTQHRFLTLEKHYSNTQTKHIRLKRNGRKLVNRNIGSILKPEIFRCNGVWQLCKND